MDSSQMAVIAAGSTIEKTRSMWASTDVSVVQWPEDLQEGGETLDRLYGEGTERFAIAGGDDLVGRVVTAYRRRADLGANPLEIWPLDVGETLVADHAGGAVSTKKAVRLVEKGVDKWHRARIGTLKVTASTQPAAWYGFSFGVGWVYRALEARKRARGGVGHLMSALGRLATDTIGGDEGGDPVAARTSIDYDPVEEATGSLVASTLKKTPFGPGSGGDGALMWEGVSASELLGRVVGPGFVDGGGPQGRPFESIHLDSPDGWLLDGRLHGARDSGVVQVVPGPTVTVVRPRTGLAAMVGGVFGGR